MEVGWRKWWGYVFVDMTRMMDYNAMLVQRGIVSDDDLCIAMT